MAVERSAAPRRPDTTVSRMATPKELALALDQLDATADLPTRLDALEAVARWVIEIPTVKRLMKPAPLQLARLRTLIAALKTNAEHREKFAAVFASILKDTTAVALFSESGMPNDRGLASETIDRIARRILPRPPDDEDLERFVERVFRNDRDCAWIEAAPVELWAELGSLIGDIWQPLRESMADAVALLCTRISALGLSAHLRERSESMHVRDSPFFRMPNAPIEQLPTLLLECRGQLATIRKIIETAGVSVDVVYCMDAIRKMLARIERILPFLAPPADPAERVLSAREMIAALTAGRIEDDSLRQLGRHNLGLLAQKVIERVGQAGEQNLTVTRKEWFKMFAQAAAGGAFTVLTIIFKFLLKAADFAPFLDGLTASLNYGLTFVALQMLGLALAAKQSSATAAALAATLRESKGEPALDDLVTLIARMTRTQFVAVCGNVLTVVPVVILIDLAWLGISGDHFLGRARALEEAGAYDPFRTWTVVYAAYTGVLLWLSSIAAGWLENWVAYRRLPDAIRFHRSGKVVGFKRLDRIANFVANQSSGIGGNLSLGLMFGMTAPVMAFFGIGLETRHITIATGSLTFAVCALGIGSLTVASVIGIALIGIMNFFVAFFLALSVALSGRDVSFGQRWRLLKQVLHFFVRHPMRFFFPPKIPILMSTETPPAPTAT